MEIKTQILTFLSSYNLSEKDSELAVEMIISIFYIDLYERLIKDLPQAEQDQARSYLTKAEPEINLEHHQKIKEYIQSHMTKEQIDAYVSVNLPRIFERISGIVGKSA